MILRRVHRKPDCTTCRCTEARALLLLLLPPLLPSIARMACSFASSSRSITTKVAGSAAMMTANSSCWQDCSELWLLSSLDNRARQIMCGCLPYVGH